MSNYPELANKVPDDIVKEETTKIFNGLFAVSEEISTIASFLVSDGAKYINGTTVTVDGGYQ